MKLYNTLSKKVEEIQPIDGQTYRIYSCGPTVYNNLHIGNLSAFIYADLLGRSLRAQGKPVQHVMNITDVDDKTIRDSKKLHPDLEPKVALKKLTDKYTKVFYEDLKKTGNDVNSIQFISAVDSIDEMVNLIQKIINNGIAYLADDGIYFSVENYKKNGHTYGLLQKIDPSSTKSRIENDEYDKNTASDFALWKKSKPDEPSWPAQFNIDGKQTLIEGRPGWHIECSAMSQSALDTPFDIHTGGIDLKFPHHENEIAQTCASGEEMLCQVFVHNNHILVDGKKMSKSLGNFFTLRDIEEKGYSADAFRLLVLSSHYQNESNFSWVILESSQNLLNKWQKLCDRVWQENCSETSLGAYEDALKYLENNLNTPELLSLLASYFNGIAGKEKDKACHRPKKSDIVAIERLTGIKLIRQDITDEHKDLLHQRQKARAEKDFALSDKLRDQLKQQGIDVEDKDSAQIWAWQ